uniref:Uncharacterized protein n=1 Tax=Desulfobacca acetoxidans TaxID=60893 RepID=A0A7V4G8U7_9BACT
MSKLGELDLVLPIPKFETYPSYFIGAGGMGYLIISWLMYYLDQYLPQGQGMDHFKGARFLVVDTALPDNDQDLPSKQWASSQLFRMTGKLDDIIQGAQQGFFPGINDFYEDTPVARQARDEIGNDLMFGAATTRPFGRLGFFYKWDEFYNQLRQMVQAPIQNQDMRYGSNFNILTPTGGGLCRRFLIVSSLAGGTGSSCFLDIAATLRLLQRTGHFQYETWDITGIFTLADVLAVDTKIDKELKKTKMKANTYAALKELNHFLDGNTFYAKYGRNGDKEIRIPDSRSEKLFDRVFLVDTPNHDQRPLSGRKEVAQFLAQTILLLGTTSIGQGFYNRLVDTAAIMAFKKKYPATSQRDITQEKQYFHFSTLGLSTLTLPTNGYLKYAKYRLAAELLENLFKLTPIGDPVQMAGQVANNAGLTEAILDHSFSQCFSPVLDSRGNCLQMVQQAGNPMQTLRQFATSLEGLPASQIKQSANQTAQALLQRVFPVGGQGPVEKALDELVSQGQLPAVNAILNELMARLKQYGDRLTNELEEATIRAAHQEAPAGITGQPTGILQNPTFVGLLSAMENSWRNWGAALGRGIYRRWFLSRFDGGIRRAIAMLFDSQDLARILLIWPEKIGLVDRLTDRIRNLKDRYGQQLKHHQNVLTELVNKQTQSEVELATMGKSRFRESAISAKEYYQKIFLSNLPGTKNDLINRWVADLQANGLPLEGKRVKQGDWSKSNADDLATAISKYCWENIIRIPGSPDQELTQADPLYRVGLDHELFLPSDLPSPFQQVKQSWMAKAQVSLLFSDKPETSGYIIAGCRTDGSFAWNDVLNMPGLTTFKGGPPNQATLLTFALGFPLQHVNQVYDWYKKAYIPQKREGWPLHLFKEADLDLMMEPYLHWTGLPNQQEAEELLTLAEESGIISFSQRTTSSGATEVTAHIESRDKLLSLPERIREFFFRTQPQAKGYEWNELINFFQKNDRLLNALQHALRSKKADWNEEATVEDLLKLAKDHGLLETGDLGQFSFNLEIYEGFAGSQEEFCEAFFHKSRPVLQKISRNKLLLGLTRHEPLCRWITKRVVRALLNPIRLEETQKRFREGKYSNYLREILKDYMP